MGRQADTFVPHPYLDGAATEGLPSSNRFRSQAARLKEVDRQARRRVQVFKKTASRFQVPTTLTYLNANRLKEKVKRKLESVCNRELGPNAPSRCFSAQYFDENGVLLFCYMGERWKDAPQVNGFYLFL